MNQFKTFYCGLCLLLLFQCTTEQQPEKVNISFNDNPEIGSSDAPVQLIVFTDFECGHCKQLAEHLKDMKEDYMDKGLVRLQVWDYPLEFHENAVPAAVSAYCAEEQGSYWEMYDKLYSQQETLSDSLYLVFARDLDLDTMEFQACLLSTSGKAKVDSDFATGEAIGITGTPTFIINGDLYTGAPPKDILIELIEQELNGVK